MIKDKQSKEKTRIEIKQDILENHPEPVYLGIGSNLGNRKNNINKALLSLKFFSSADEIILRSFTKILQDISGRYFPARGKGVSRIINQIKQKSLTKTTIGGCVIEKIENSVVISKENTK